MAEFIPRDVPFAYDPAATAAFARLRSEVGDDVLHDTAAPVKAVVIGGGTGAPVSIRTLLLHSRSFLRRRFTRSSAARVSACQLYCQRFFSSSSRLTARS